jgi:hypothetical protein
MIFVAHVKCRTRTYKDRTPPGENQTPWRELAAGASDYRIKKIRNERSAGSSGKLITTQDRHGAVREISTIRQLPSCPPPPT